MKTVQELKIVIVGVGGQGTLLASRVLGHIAQQKGFDVKVSEVHGMSQRGGSVITYVSMGEKVFSPLIEQAQADFVLAFEELEALRAAPYVKKGGTLIMNSQQIMPLPVIIGAAQYPQNIAQSLKEGANVVVMDALQLAKKAGNQKAVNTVLLGAMARQLNWPKDVWQKALTACVPAKFLDANLAAFKLGFDEEENDS